MSEPTDVELLAYLGTDAVRWAQEWTKTARHISERYGMRSIIQPVDEYPRLGWMIGWFANAIEAGRSAGHAKAQQDVAAASSVTEQHRAEGDSRFTTESLRSGRQPGSLEEWIGQAIGAASTIPHGPGVHEAFDSESAKNVLQWAVAGARATLAAEIESEINSPLVVSASFLYRYGMADAARIVRGTK